MSVVSAVAAVVCLTGITLQAAPQESAAAAPTSLSRIKSRLDQPAAKPLKPSEPVQLRPTFRTRTTGRPFVPTLEEHLHDTFELTDFQRSYAKYAARCCGIDIGALFNTIEKALDERRERKIHDEVARELAFVEAAAAKPVR
jgi:hypothetical protein